MQTISLTHLYNEAKAVQVQRLREFAEEGGTPSEFMKGEEFVNMLVHDTALALATNGVKLVLD